MNRRRILLTVAAVWLIGMLAAWLVTSISGEPLKGTWKSTEIGKFTLTRYLVTFKPDGTWDGYIAGHFWDSGTWRRAAGKGKMELASREILRDLGAWSVIRYEVDGYEGLRGPEYEFYVINRNRLVVTTDGASPVEFQREPGLLKWKARLKEKLFR